MKLTLQNQSSLFFSLNNKRPTGKGNKIINEKYLFNIDSLNLNAIPSNKNISLFLRSFYASQMFFDSEIENL